MNEEKLDNKSIRLDLFLFYIRIFKSRNLASKFINSNRLRVSDTVTQKPHKLISISDVITFSINNMIKVIEVTDIPVRRGSYVESLNYYKDISPIQKTEKKEEKIPILKFVERVGRPTKLERRQTDKLMRRD
jgi:ribosome-associated heat shock protein Hsp15